jgi:uncharacterized protein YxjI
MDRLQSHDALAIHQRKEWGEILSGFETRNNYAVSAPDGADVYAVGESGGSFLVRVFLKALRPFTLTVVGLDGTPAFEIRRPFRFFFHEATIYDCTNTLQGTVRREFSLLRRRYTVRGADGHETFTLLGPLLHPWTFEIQRNGMSQGKITKRWSGLGKEMFTDADSFGIAFPSDIDTRTKAVLLGAVFLIDFVHFENHNN